MAAIVTSTLGSGSESDGPPVERHPSEASVEWERVQELFLEASELAGAAREEFLRAAPESAPVVEEVRAMLRADEGVAPAIERRLLARPAAEVDGPEPSAARGAASWIGRRIGAYRVESVLGEGGMGQVFGALRVDRQFEQRVAIKVLRRPAGADHETSRRFALERQLLARLEHPHIARLLDGGSLEDGTPYLVMQYVEGDSIDLFCDSGRLGVAERLRLFLDVCGAVQFAHSNLVIHRDLKPGNILVEPSAGAGGGDRVDGALDPVAEAPGHVRLLDFGIAKLLEPDALDASLQLTQARSRPMTPLYAAPEQFAGEPLTTATDVYALGALLFELLTGETPHSTAGTASDFEARVRHEQPRTLRSAMSAGGGRGDSEATTATARARPDERARARGTTVEGLDRALDEDLQRIVARALDRDPERRYRAAGDLGADLRRYLRGEAITVREDTMGYRMRVFLRRNRVLASVVGLFVLALVVLSALLLRQTLLAQRAVERADAESARSRAVASTLVDLFSTADAREGPTGGEIPINDFLERMEHSADALEGDPALHADLLEALGQIYAGRDESRRALDAFQRASVVHARVDPGTGGANAHRDRRLHLEVQAARAAAQVDQAQGLERLARSLEEHRRAYGSDDARTLAVALAHASHRSPTAAITVLDGLVVDTRAVFGVGSPEVAQVLRARGEKHAWAGQHEEARSDYRQALAILEGTFGPDHPETLETLGELTQSLPIPGNLPLLRELLERQERVFGADSGPVAQTLDTLGVTLVRQGDMQGASENLRRSWEILRRVHGETSPRTLNTARNVAIVASMLGDYTTGLPLLRTFVEHLSVPRSRHFGTVQLAFLEARADPSPSSLRSSLERIARSVKALEAQRTGSADRYPGDARLFFARILLADEQPAEALRQARHSLADRLDDERPDDARILQARFFIARAETALGRAGSREALREALAEYEAWGPHERLEARLARRQLGD